MRKDSRTKSGHIAILSPPPLSPVGLRRSPTGVPPDSAGVPPESHRTPPDSARVPPDFTRPPESGGVRWDSGGIRWRPVESGGTPVESSGKQGVGGCWVSLGPKFGPEPKFEPELLRTRSKFSPKFSILLN